MRKLSKALTFMVTIILRSLFLYGFSILRKGSTLLSVAHTSIAIIYGLNNIQLLIFYTLPIIVLYTFLGMHILLLYTFTISSIPSLWMAITQLLLDLAKGFLDPFKYIAIYAKAILVSINTMYILHTLNPTEISTVFSKVKMSAGVYPHLFLRISSFLIKEGIEVIHTHSLKREKMWKTLAILILRGEELAKGFSEGLIPKYRGFKAIAIYNLKALAIQLSVIIFDLTITLIYSYI